MKLVFPTLVWLSVIGMIVIIAYGIWDAVGG